VNTALSSTQRLTYLPTYISTTHNEKSISRSQAELIEDMDDNLFQRILWDKNHILHALLPDRRRSLEYELRSRSHDRELVPKVNSLTESNFLIRQLYKNCY